MSNVFNLLQINLVKELGFDNLPDDEREAVLADMEQIVTQRILVAGMSVLTDEQLDEVDMIASPEAVVEYLQNNIPNFELLVMDEIANFKEEMLAMSAAASDQVDAHFANKN